MSHLIKLSCTGFSSLSDDKSQQKAYLNFSQAIRRLVNLAYPTVPENVRDTPAKQHFIEALADSEMRIRIKQSRLQNLNDAIRLAVELETFNRAERRVTEGRSYLRTTTADSTAGKVSDKTKDETDMMKLMTDMQKRLSDLQEMSTSLRTKNSDHANLITHQDLIMDVVKLTNRIMVVDVSIDKTLVVVKIIDKTGIE